MPEHSLGYGIALFVHAILLPLLVCLRSIVADLMHGIPIVISILFHRRRTLTIERYKHISKLNLTTVRCINLSEKPLSLAQLPFCH